MIVLDTLGVLALGEIPLDPVGQSTRIFDLPQRARRPINLDTWLWAYNLNLRGQDKLPTGDNVTALAPGQLPVRPLSLRSWIWSYNLNLVGQDELPFRQQSWPVPTTLNRAAITFIGPFVFPVVESLPFNQYAWPLPTLPTPPVIMQNPNLTLSIPPPFVPMMGQIWM